MRRSALEQGIVCLSARMHSAGELAEKLQRKGYEEAEINEALSRLRDYGYLDDQRYADALSRSLQRRGYGPGRVSAELSRRRVSREDKSYAMEEMADSMDVLRGFLARKFPEGIPEEKREKTFAALVRRGFSSRDVRRAMEEAAEFIQDSDER